MRRLIAAATTSRGARSSSGWTPTITRSPARVVEDRALAAHGLADQRLLADGVGPAPHHGRVELHELDVAHRRARPAARSPTPSPVTAGGFDVEAKTWP